MNRGLRRALERLGPEDALSVQVKQWCEIVAPWDNPSAPFRWMHIPNQRRTGKYPELDRLILIEMGLIQGAADWLFWNWWKVGVAPSGTEFTTFRPLFIELKSPRGRQTKNQRLFQERCWAAYYECRSLEEVQAALREEGLL